MTYQTHLFLFFFFVTGSFALANPKDSPKGSPQRVVFQDQNGSVEVMITGDYLKTAIAIARRCRVRIGAAGAVASDGVDLLVEDPAT